MELVGTIFNIAVVIGIAIYWILTFAILYHLTRFGIGTQPKRFAAIFLFGSVFLSSAYAILFAIFDINSILTLI
jgi:hypothetical protein